MYIFIWLFSYFFYFVYFLSGFWSAAIIVCVSDLVGEADIGKAVGYSLAVGSVAFLIAPPLAGKLSDVTMGYIYIY